MGGPEFYTTLMGQKFYSHDVPKGIEAINRLAAALEDHNKLSSRSRTEDHDVLYVCFLLYPMHRLKDAYGIFATRNKEKAISWVKNQIEVAEAARHFVMVPEEYERVYQHICAGVTSQLADIHIGDHNDCDRFAYSVCVSIQIDKEAT